MAYNSLYQHFPPYTPPISSPPPSTSNNNNNHTTNTNTSQSSCSPAKSEPVGDHSGHNSAVSSACFNKWPGQIEIPLRWNITNKDILGQGGSVPDILSPFQSYDQHHHNLNYYMYLQSHTSNTGHNSTHPHPLPPPITSHYNN